VSTSVSGEPRERLQPTTSGIPAAQAVVPAPGTGPDADADFAARWPDVAVVPRCSRARVAVTRALVRRAVARLPLRVRLLTPQHSTGETLGLGGPLLTVTHPDAFFRRLGTNGLIGFGESYMAGEWDSPDPTGVLTVLAEHVDRLFPESVQRLRGLWAPRKPAAQLNTPEGSRSNIQQHYDLSNDLFALFLDKTLTYSSAVFQSFPADFTRLPDAQHRKIDRLLDLAEVGPGTRLLEIGTGWGELAIRAAGRGAEVVSLTLSAEQRTLAMERIREAGHQDRATVLLADYREATGSYDAVVSVEMVEAVGAEYWPAYFTALDRLLAPGGRVALQAITMADHRLLATQDTYTWIHKYIFPGGLIPSVEALTRTAEKHTGLRLTRCDGYGAHYAETLRLWRERFEAHAQDVEALGFDATFRRMWTLYLAYCEAGFLARYLDVQQIQLTREGGRTA
jgi:cyclopropane-fatty-acyl-phospholipid synthase